MFVFDISANIIARSLYGSFRVPSFALENSKQLIMRSRDASLFSRRSLDVADYLARLLFQMGDIEHLKALAEECNDACESRPEGSLALAMTAILSGEPAKKITSLAEKVNLHKIFVNTIIKFSIISTGDQFGWGFQQRLQGAGIFSHSERRLFRSGIVLLALC